MDAEQCLAPTDLPTELLAVWVDISDVWLVKLSRSITYSSAFLTLAFSWVSHHWHQHVTLKTLSWTSWFSIL